MTAGGSHSGESEDTNNGDKAGFNSDGSSAGQYDRSSNTTFNADGSIARRGGNGLDGMVKLGIMRVGYNTGGEDAWPQAHGQASFCWRKNGQKAC